MERITLKPETVALRASAGMLTAPRFTIAVCGLEFTREPVLLLVEDLGQEKARSLCFDLHVRTEQLTQEDLDELLAEEAGAEPEESEPAAEPRKRRKRGQ